jgi:hypothetical protein
MYITCDNDVNNVIHLFRLLPLVGSVYTAVVPKTDFLAFRVTPELKRDIERLADEEQRNISQICEMLLFEGVETYKKEGAKFIQRLVAKQKMRTK